MSDQDERTIINLLNRYGLAMDARRWDLFDTIFTADVDLNYFGLTWHDLPTFKAEFSKAHEHFDATQHAMANHLVDVSGDNASAFTYCLWRLIAKGTQGGDAFFGAAWYDDLLARTAAGWRIRKRSCRVLWTDGNPRATGAPESLPWDVLRDQAAAGSVAYLQAIARSAR
jgi:3-phenylpropionate/cinnamic acid dioxygenase small subunit